MLQAINDRIKGWLGIVIVVLIGLPFAFWGIQSYMDDAGPRYAAKVNNIEISANEFERSVSVQRQSLLRQYGGQLPIEEKTLRERTLTQLINQRLLESVTYEDGYRISDSILSAKIKQLFTVDGVFDRLRFEANASSIGMSIPAYEQALRNELRLQQMQTAISNSSFATRKEINNLAALNEQTRDITVLTFGIEHFSTAKKPSKEEIKQYYEANLQRFMSPEKVKVDYLEITSDALSKNIDIDEDQIKKMYDDYVASISGREERKARHILLQVKTGDAASETAAKEKIQSLKKELEQGADFAELASKYSQDTGSAEDGGDLGWVALGEMVKPFERVLFDMSKGAVSDVVKTQFGYHLIKLDDIRGEKIETFDAKRGAFEEELKADGIASIFYDLSERLASITYENPDSLDVAAEDLGLTIQHSNYFTRVKGDGIAANEQLRNMAFSPLVLTQGSNSDLVEISPTHVVVFRLNDRIAATAIPLELVSSKIENILNVKNGHKQTKEAAAAIKARIEAGESIDSLKVDGIIVDVIASLGRTDNSKVSDTAILHNAFEIAPGKEDAPSVKEVDLISGDVALIVLTKVNIPEEISQDKLEQVKNDVLRDSSAREFSNTLLAIKDSADIEKNTRLVQKQ